MDETEDDEDSSSSSASSCTFLPLQVSRVESSAGQLASSLDEELAKFRLQWHLELTSRFSIFSSSKEGYDRISTKHLSDGADDENYHQPDKLYKLAMLCEQNGRVAEAVQLYRRAIKLNPEVERKFAYPASKPHTLKEYNPRPTISSRRRTFSNQEIINNDRKIDVHYFKDLLRHSCNSESPIRYCTPENTLTTNQSATHIGSLPAELLIHIFKWVVSSHLDVRQLEQLSMVCRGFYILCRDEELWKVICHKTWPFRSCANNEASSYRQAYIEKPHLFYTGVYISKISYIRRGEDNSFQDRAFAERWHLVSYYRYLRFFHDGQVAMLTTAEEPVLVLPYLKHTKSLQTNSLLANAALFGTFTIESDGHVTVVLKRYRKNTSHDSPSLLGNKRRPLFHQLNVDLDQSFIMELNVSSSKRHRNHILQWLNYYAKTKYKNTGQEVTNEFQLSDKNFPPLYFSRVKSFSNFADACL